MVNKARKVFDQPLLDVAMSSYEARKLGCTGCLSPCGDFSGPVGQKTGKRDGSISFGDSNHAHIRDSPSAGNYMVGSAAVTGLGDGSQLVALVLGLAIGALV